MIIFSLYLILLFESANFLLVGGNLDQQFQLIAAMTYHKIMPCLMDAWMMKDVNTTDWKFPSDGEDHYKDLKSKTAMFRNAPIHEYAGYEGPWIENIFISKFIDKPLHYFNGLIPLFIQWIDNQILRKHYFDAISNELRRLLRPNVIYLAISQGDIGLGKIGVAHPNILVMSAGGFGHIPLPLIKGEISWRVMPEIFTQDFGFFGTIHQSNRLEMLNIIQKTAESLNMTHKQGFGSSWQHDMETTRINLSPRGYGRSSFRFAESIQMGRFPAFIFNDIPWVPYQGTNLTVENYGYCAGLTPQNNTLIPFVHQVYHELVDEHTRLNHSDIKLEALRDVRWHYTYDGVIHQIHQFLQDPFGHHGGQLRCQTHPRNERCCDTPKETFSNYTLIRYHADKQVFLVENGQKRSIPNLDVFMKYNFEFRDIKVLMNRADIDDIPLGRDLQ